MLEIFTSPLSLLFWLTALVIAITIHEFAHAFVADRLGDPTPRISGRLTLNPFAHLDPLGTLALLIVHFGWGKPVPVDSFNLRNPKRDVALVSLAGPVSNLILAVILSLLLRLIFVIWPPFIFSFQLFPVIYVFLQTSIALNVTLAIFNLLPIGPLDGAKILIGFLPPKQSYQVEEILNQYGLFILLFLLIPLGNQPPLIAKLISPLINFIINLLI